MASSSSASSTNAKAPQLASASGAGGGMPHALWRPQMQTFLMQHGIEERDYAQEISRWCEMVKAADDAAAKEDEDAEAFVLDGDATKLEEEKADATTKAQIKMKQRVADRIGRVRKAFSYLHSALPSDLRTLIADVPKGYAYGVWSFLEKKFRNTEHDMVMSLWETVTAMRQESDEQFDAYKARVDSVAELLANAKQTLPSGLYMSLLLWRLQPRYNTAVLTLKASAGLKDPTAVNWTEIAEYMAQFERAQLGLGEIQGGTSSQTDRAMAARGKSQPSEAPARDSSKVECYNCHKLGHYASDCQEEDRRKHKFGGSKGRRNKSGWTSRTGDRSRGDESSDETPANANVNSVRGGNRYSPLSSDDDDAAVPKAGRSYLARVLAGLDVERSKPAASGEKTPRAAKKNKAVMFGPQTEAKSRESDRRAPSKSLDVALRTTAKAVDSGATVSITGTKDNLINVRRCTPMPILMADKTVVNAVYKGDMPMRLAAAEKSGTRVSVMIPDVYYHERIDANLLSWGCMRLDGWEMHSTKDETYLVTPKGTRINASTRGRLTILDDAGPERAYAARLGRFVCQTAEDLVLLHRRVGHASWGRLLKMCRSQVTNGIGDISGMSSADLTKAETLVKQCEACIAGKSSRNPLGHRGLEKGKEPGEVLHMDTFYVTLRDPQNNNKKYHEYCLLGTDSYTEGRQVQCTTSLHDLQDGAIQMMRNMHADTKRWPRLVVTDLGTEFDNKKVRDFCREHGIHLQCTPARAKELNGVAEKSVDTVKNHVRAMLEAAGLPEQKGWTCAVRHHVYVWNRTHIGAVTSKTPYEALYGREPSIVHIGEFGCDAFMHNDRTQRDTTFSPKAEPCIYLGHDFEQNCAIVHVLRTGKTQKVKDVLFREGSFKHLQADLDGQACKVKSIDLSDFGDNFDDDHDDDSESSNSDHENVDESQEYDVESIASHRMANGVKQYEVRWVGYPNTSWEPADMMLEDAPDAVKQYETFQSQRTEARVTRSASRAAAASSSASGSSAVVPSSSSSSAAKSVESGAADDDDSSKSDLVMAARAAAQCL